jgi:predicted helicase
MSLLNLKPAHASIKNYYDALHQFGQLYIDHEGAVRSAFQDLLATCGRKLKLTLVPEFEIKRKHSSIRVDGALLDTFHLAHGYWEAKDEKDDLDREIKAKLEKGYPRDNIIFQAPERAVLYQSGARIADENISQPDTLVQIVTQFFDYKAPHIEEWEQAVVEFSERIPELAAAVKKIIDEERRRNPAFVHSFEDFYALCRQAINPNLSEDAVERMLIQHLLTERIFERIFDNPDFTRRNVVAAEIEKVIVELTKRAFNRNEFLRPLDRFYKAIEVSAENTTGFSEKQAFLNKVYERFFQGYSPKEADTHGIVYTPQPIVNFMVRSVEEILQKEFGRSLGDKGVHILDPFVGTGNFIVNIMDKIKATDLPYKYENELHCNEVMLLPYYIASMNIEHAYFERTGEYSAFPGICLVDTFELAEADQSGFSFMTAENAERVKRQRESPIFVIIGNPPYNAQQLDENDNSKNRKYPTLDKRISETYAADSGASSLTKLGDPYVKAIRWATDRLGEEGIVAFVSNNSFLDQIAFDGARKNLMKDFQSIYVLDLGGNVRKNPKLSGTTHNVFGIQVGVSIEFFVRRKAPAKTKQPASIQYANVDAFWRKEEKFRFLSSHDDIRKIDWRTLEPDRKNTWLTEGLREDFEGFVPLGDKERSSTLSDTVFKLYSLGINTNRDAWAYNFGKTALIHNVRQSIDFYNEEVGRYVHAGKPSDLDSFVRYDEGRISWSRDLKQDLKRGRTADFKADNVRMSMYRPFCQQYLFFDRVFNEEVYLFHQIFPSRDSENIVIWEKIGTETPHYTLAVNMIPNLMPQGGSQCFPFYTYAEDGTHRRENITDWALEQFRSHYHDPSITKWDIFHYIYAVLHHPEYRERYAANLRRELPRIPFASATPSNPSHPERSPAMREANGGAESKDPIPADTHPKPGKEFSARNAADSAPTSERPYAKLSAEAKERVLSEVKAMQDAGELHYTSKDDARVFRALAKAGQRLAEIHVHYEKQPEYKLTTKEKAGEKLNYRVTKMRLSKDKTTLIYNDFLTLSDIPKETYDYRLGNRSALEWVIDQYQVSTDKRSGITNDPNREDDPEYILRLIGQVVTVSLETVKLVRSLPSLLTPPKL